MSEIGRVSPSIPKSRAKLSGGRSRRLYAVTPSSHPISSLAMTPPDSPPLLRAHLSSVDQSPPKDWQAFQRKCVPLFRRMLNDQHASEYGRGGQNQRGVDILLYRDGDPNQQIGIQCRRVAKPLKKKRSGPTAMQRWPTFRTCGGSSSHARPRTTRTRPMTRRPCRPTCVQQATSYA